MHATRKASPLSNSDNKPLPFVPSNTVSSQNSPSTYLEEKRNSFASPRSPKANTPNTTPPALSSIDHSPTNASSLSTKHAPLQSLKHISNACSSPLPSIPSSARARPMSALPKRNSMPSARVKRWAGLTRKVDDWDNLRKDPELWFEDGDCLIHLYARGQSQRGPSFCVPFQALQQGNCGAMFSLCFAQKRPRGPTTPNPRRTPSVYSAPTSSTSVVELYIPAPDNASKEISFKWHLTTRNFFAFVFGKPLVGKHMGQTLVELQERMHLFRSGQVNNHQDFLDYAEHQGYRDLLECTDYALAMLYYAEHYKLRDIWIDAFAHCVGMNHTLNLSQEFEPISRLTKALITRSYLDMDIHLDRVKVAVSNFLEDDFSPALLGLSVGGRIHLDRFRTFLHGYYVEKFGYWPPHKGSSYSQALFKSMYFDFKNLYEYLVDLESTVNISSQKPASGGICVLQNVETFDRRHKFNALPHPLPLLPESIPLVKKTHSQKALRTLTLSFKQTKRDQCMATQAALTIATNSKNVPVTSYPLVQDYVRYEEQCALSQRDEKVSMADGRKIRWLLIYGTLQYLISAVRAPKEVRDSEGSTYPLCCLVTEKSPWQLGTKTLTAPAVASVNVPEAINTYLSESGCDTYTGTPKTSSIEPDCQTGDYFTHTNQDATLMASRPVSVEIPAPLRPLRLPSPSPARNTSIRTFRRPSFGSLSSRRNSISLQTPSHSNYETPVNEQGKIEALLDPSSQTVSRSGSIKHSNRSSQSILPEGCGPESSWLRPLTPDSVSHPMRLSNLQVHCKLDSPHQPVSPIVYQEPLSSSDSAISSESQFWSDKASTSSKSSTGGEQFEPKDRSIEDSGLLGGLVSIGGPAPGSRKWSRSTSASNHDEFRFNFTTERTELALLSGFPTAIEAIDSAISIGVALSTPLSSPATARSKSTPPDLDATPPPIRKASSNNLSTKTQKLFDEEERNRKKQHRLSFWRG